MGLAETRRKQKFAPSNFGPSAWSNAAPTSSVGFKLMSSMGWAPGQGLGNDLQGERDTVKYSLKDDFLGIGAKKEYGGGLWRGTGEVDDLYRRLEIGGNKPSEEVVEVIEEVKEVKKVRNRWQMNFQVGDVYTSSFSKEGSEAEGTNSSVESSTETSGEKKSKKRKRHDENCEKKKEISKEKSGQNKDNPHSKKEGGERSNKVSKRQKFEENTREERLKRKMEKKAHSQPADNKNTDTVSPEVDSAIAASQESKKDKRSKNKAKERKKTKEEKEGKKEGKREGKKEGKKKNERKSDKGSSSKKKRKDKPAKHKDTEAAPSNAYSSTLEPVAASFEAFTETIIPRHMHRARFLAMKRASVMDQRALREILGVKG